jgi:alkylhydroperoxidase family enzyme
MTQQQAGDQTKDEEERPAANFEEERVSRKPRLEPIEKPKGFTLRFLYWVAPRQFGKVPTSIKVLVTRVPKAMKLFSAVGGFESKGIRLDKELHYMIAMFVSGINGCGFCLDFGRMMAVKDDMRMEKFNALPGYRTSSLFSDRERAALAYVEEATRNKRVSDGTFDELREHFADWEIAEITILSAIQNFENLLHVPLEIGSDGLCAIAQARKKK